MIMIDSWRIIHCDAQHWFLLPIIILRYTVSRNLRIFIKVRHVCTPEWPISNERIYPDRESSPSLFLTNWFSFLWRGSGATGWVCLLVVTRGRIEDRAGRLVLDRGGMLRMLCWQRFYGSVDWNGNFSHLDI